MSDSNAAATTIAEFKKQFPAAIVAIRVITIDSNSDISSIEFYDISQMSIISYVIRSYVFVNGWRMDISSVNVDR